jgi:hypothetical protein
VAVLRFALLTLPQNCHLKPAAELGVMGFLNYFCRIVESMKEQKQNQKAKAT